MEITCLATGSSGNAYLVKMGRHTFLLDAGIKFDKLITSVNLNKLDFAFISHEHNDHSKSSLKLAIRGTEVIRGINYQTFSKVALKTKLASNFHVFSFPVNHGDVKCGGFIASDGEVKEQMLYITDFNMCKFDLRDFRFTKILVECNYYEAMLPSVFDFKARRQINTHMGLKGLKKFLKGLDLSQTKEIILCHTSNQYGDRKLMREEIEHTFGIKTGVCLQYGGIDYGEV